MYNRIIGIVGPTGSGKSYVAASLMAQQPRAAIYQIVRDDTNYLHCATHVCDGDLRGFCKILGEDNFRCVYLVDKSTAEVRTKTGNKGFTFPDFEVFVRACFHRQQMLMIIDEAHFLCDPRFIPAYLWECIVTGRHKFLDIIYITQGFSMVHRDITRNTHEFYFWKIIEPADLQGIADRCGYEVSEQVEQLRATDDQRKTGGKLVPGEVLHWKV